MSWVTHTIWARARPPSPRASLLSSTPGAWAALPAWPVAGQPFTRRGLVIRLALCSLGALTGLALAALLLAAFVPTRPVRAAPRSLATFVVVTTTIQAAIDAAQPGDTVWVPAGRYTESLTLSKAVSLTGVSSPTVILQALPGQRVLTVTGAISSSVVISGLTFTGGAATGQADCPAGCGGGLLITGTAQPTLQNLLITGNMAQFRGGGLYAHVGGPLSLTNVEFRANSAGTMGGGAFAYRDLTLISGRFHNNTSGGSVGGLSAVTVDVTGTDFISNTSLGSGGALAASGVLRGGLFRGNRCLGWPCSGGALSGGVWTITGTQFISNSASAGGAASIGGGTIEGALFLGNTCSDSSCAGGALTTIGPLNLTNSQLLSNTSPWVGAGLYTLGPATVTASLFQGNACTRAGCQGAGLWAFLDLTVSHTTFISNTALSHGGGLFASAGLTVTGGLFAGNTCTQAGCQGGGLFAYGSLAVSGTEFRQNGAAGDGGGLAHGQVFAGTSPLNVVNALFAGNSASGHGQALYLSRAGVATLLHNTIVGPGVGGGAAVYITNTTASLVNTLVADYGLGLAQGGGSVVEDYNLFSGVTLAISGTVNSGGHSLTGPAAFRNPAAGDYHLTFGSAAVDAGANIGLTADFECDPRPHGDGFDIGFDELSPYGLYVPLVRR